MMKQKQRLPKNSSFRCRQCGAWRGYDELNLDANERPICQDCYLKDPPQEDVDGIFAEVAARWHGETRLAGECEHAIEGACGACGGTTYNGRCTNACR